MLEKVFHPFTIQKKNDNQFQRYNESVQNDLEVNWHIRKLGGHIFKQTHIFIDLSYLSVLVHLIYQV